MRPMPDPCCTVCTRTALCFWDFTGKIYLCYYTWGGGRLSPHTNPFVFLQPAWISTSHLGFSSIKRWHHSPNCLQMRPRRRSRCIFRSSAQARLVRAQATADNQKRCMMSCRRSIRAPAYDWFSRKPFVVLPFPLPSFPDLFLFSFCLQFFFFHSDAPSVGHNRTEVFSLSLLSLFTLFSPTQWQKEKEGEGRGGRRGILDHGVE